MDDLYEAWQANKDRPAWVRENREAIMDHADTSEAIPDGSLAQVRRWLESYKGAVTRQLNPENGDSTNTDADEGDA